MISYVAKIYGFTLAIGILLSINRKEFKFFLHKIGEAYEDLKPAASLI